MTRTEPRCPNCASDRGWYDGPNGKPRCLHCFHDRPVATKAVAPEPKQQTDPPVKNKAVAPPEPFRADRRQPAKAKGK